MAVSARLRFDWLSIRVILGVVLVVIGPLAIGIYVLSRVHFERTLEAQRRSAALQNRILEVTLRHEMKENDRALIAATLAELGKEPDVKQAMVLDHRGIIRHASDPTRVGAVIPRHSPTCFTCHAVRPSERHRSVVYEDAQGTVLRAVQPIENRPECHGCHDPAARLNGILVLDISLAGIQAQLGRDRIAILAGTSLLALVLTGGLGLVVRHLVLRRLYRLGRTARAIAAGKLSERAAREHPDLIGDLAGDLNSMADATEKLLSELAERETRLAMVLDSLDDGLIVLDRDRRVVVFNQSFCRRTGASPETILGRGCRSNDGHPHCRARGDDCPTSRCFRTGQPQRATFRISREGDAGERVEEVIASPVFDDAGEVVRVVEIWRDITERVQEEEHLAAVERLSALGALASGFTHEMGTPLASMLTCAEGVIARADDAGRGVDGQRWAEVRDYAEIIRREVLRCSRVSDQFRRFTRGIPPSVEPLDLSEVVASVANLVRPAAREANVALDVQEAEGLPAVMANPEVVQHVMLNLLINSIQSMGESGGTARVTFQTGPEVKVLVEDTGSGIPSQVQEHLFEPFRSAKVRGTGLGLFLSRTFMRRFGGDVRLVKSQPRQGSCFEVVFRRAEVASS